MDDGLLEAALSTARDATERADAVLAPMTDAQARQPSRLPGWTRGHIATHLARNADGNRNMVDGVLAGEERAMYPGGEAGRAAEIDAGAGRPAAELLEDFTESAQALDGAWNRVPDDAWSGTGITFVCGTRADLDDGVEPLPRAARAPRGSRPRLCVPPTFPPSTWNSTPTGSASNRGPRHLARRCPGPEPSVARASGPWASRRRSSCHPGP